MGYYAFHKGPAPLVGTSHRSLGATGGASEALKFVLLVAGIPAVVWWLDKQKAR